MPILIALNNINGSRSPTVLPASTTSALIIDLSATDDYPDGVLVAYAYGENVPIAPLIDYATAPRWGVFKTNMVGSPGFLRVSAIAHTGLVAAVAGEVSRDVPSLLGLALVWNAMIDTISIAQRPTAGEIVQWQGIADIALVPIVFGSEGRI